MPIVVDITQAVVPALAGLGGAWLGGRLSRQATLEGEKQRQEFARETGQRREARELKEAARLVDEELRSATQLIRNAVFQAKWWAPSRQLSGDVYGRYRRVLAVALEDAAWSDVSHAFQELNRVNGDVERQYAEVEAGRASVPPGATLALAPLERLVSSASARR